MVEGSLSGTNIYAIMLEGTGYTDGLVGGTYTPATPVETTTTLVLDSTVYVAEESTVTFTATDAGWYTFTVSETSGQAQFYSDASSYTALFDEGNGSTSYTVQLEADGNVSFYVTNADEGAFAITTTYSATDPDASVEVTTSLPSTLSVGDNSIALAAEDGNSDTNVVTFTPKTSGLYTFSVSGTNGYVSVNGIINQGARVYSGLSQALELEANTTYNVYFYSYDSVTSATYTLTISDANELATDHTYTLDPTETYTFTASVTGKYTFETETGDIIITSDPDSYYPDIYQNIYSNNLTYTVTIKAGVTVYIYCYSNSSTNTEDITITLTEVVTEITESSVPEALAIGDNAIALTEDDAYESVGSTFTATEAGLYTFTIAEGSDALVYFGSFYGDSLDDSSYGSYWSNYSITYYLAANDSLTLLFCTDSEEQGRYTLNISKVAVSYQELSTSDTTTLTLYSSADGYVALASFSDTAATSYYLTLSSINSYMAYNTITVTANGTELTNLDYNYNFTSVAGTNYVVISLNGYYVYADYYSYTLALTAGSYVAIETSVPTTLVTGADGNSIAISSSDASSGVARTFTAEETGLYTFDIGTSETAYVYYANSESDYNSRNYSRLSSSSSSVTLLLEKEDSIYFVFSTSTGLSASYTLTITKSAITYQTLSTEEATTLTFYASTEDNTYYAYVTYATAGSYYLTLSSTSTNWYKQLTSVTVTNGETTATGGSYNYNVTLTGNDEIVIKAVGYVSSYTFTLALTSGSYEAVTTSIPTITGAGTYNVAIGDDATSTAATTTFTPTEAGLYTFTIADEADAKVTIGSSSNQLYYYSSSSKKLTVSVAIAANEEVTLSFTTYSGLEGSYTLTVAKEALTTATLSATETVNLTYYTNASGNYVAYATFTATSTTNYVLTLGSTYSSYNYATVSVLVNGTAASVEGQQAALAVTSGETYSLVITSTYVYTSYYTYSASLAEGTLVTSTIPETLAATNTISLTAAGASSGVSGTYTLPAGTYTFSVSADEYADVYIYVGGSSYYTINIYNTKTSDTLTLSEETSITIKFAVYGASDTSNGISYTLTISGLATSGDDEGTTTGVNATVNIGSLVTAETLSATSYSANTTLYTGDDGTKVVVTATSDKTVSVDSNSKSYTDEDGETEFSSAYRLKLGGTGSSTYRSLEVTTVGACTITVYAMASTNFTASDYTGSETSRTLALYDSEYAVLDNTQSDDGSALAKYTFTVSEAGTYYIAQLTAL
ncbi:MAG: hypothetical protein LUD27_01465 [Clostridia bacterium]|nr:hypothetical protein [Clostridia bacterium]